MKAYLCLAIISWFLRCCRINKRQRKTQYRNRKIVPDITFSFLLEKASLSVLIVDL